MSMYSLIFGQNKAADAILATLGLTREAVGRFRDCFITAGEIAVYTRKRGLKGNNDMPQHCYGKPKGWGPRHEQTVTL